MTIYYTEEELAEALRRSQITFRPEPEWMHVAILTAGGELLGRIYHNPDERRFEVVDLGDITVGETDDDDTIMLAVVAREIAAVRDAKFVNFSALVDAVEAAFPTLNPPPCAAGAEDTAERAAQVAYEQSLQDSYGDNVPFTAFVDDLIGRVSDGMTDFPSIACIKALRGAFQRPIGLRTAKALFDASDLANGWRAG